MSIYLLRIIRTTAWAVVFSGLCMAAPDQSGSQGRTGVNRNSAVEETDDLIGAWLNMIDRAGSAWLPQADFTALADGAAVKQDSEKWCGIFFKPEANPHEAHPAAALMIHHATADTADIIRYDYGPAAKRLRLYETLDFVLLSMEQGGVEVLKLSQEKRPPAIAVIAQSLLNQPAPQTAWSFAFPPSIENGSRFSTDASQEPQMMPSWASRVDGGIHAGHLYFVCFKRRQSGDGRLIFLNNRHWFDGQAWAPYQRPKGR